MSVVHSYSSLSTFEQCPRKWEAQYKNKIKAPQTDSQKWGERVHKALELRVKDGSELPVGMTQWEWVGAFTDGLPEVVEVFTEKKVGLDRELREAEFFGKTVWLRGVMDLTLRVKDQAVIWDYKTGKPGFDESQLRLSAAVAFQMWPQVQRVETRFIWLQTNKAPKTVYERENVKVIWAEFMPRFKRVEEATQFPPKPSALCGWCHVKTCEFWKDGR